MYYYEREIGNQLYFTHIYENCNIYYESAISRDLFYGQLVILLYNKDAI